MGIELFNYLKRKKRVHNDNSGPALKTVEKEKVPVYEEGYHEESNTVIRLVSPKKKIKKAYQVSGLDDVVSKNNWKGWLYLAPVIILISIFLLYPLINTVIIAFTKGYNYTTNQGNGFTFDNFLVILGLKEHMSSSGALAKEEFFVPYAIPNTMIITIVTVPLSILLALIIAVALNSIKWFQKFLQTLFFLPYVTNTIAIGMVFAVIFDKNGVINSIFGLGNFAWVHGATREVAMIPLCIYIVWNSIPFKILILLSGLQGIDKQYYQAAQIDAAGKGKVLWRITVPLLSPQILYLMITSFIGAFKEYTSVVAIFNGPSTIKGSANVKNMMTIVYYVYDNISAATSYAAAAAVFLFVIILVFTVIQFQVSKTRVHY